MKVAHKVALAASLVVIIAFTAFSIFQYNSVRSALYTKAEDSVREASTSLSHEVSYWLNAKLDLINLMAETISADFSQDSIDWMFAAPVLKQQFLLVFGGLETDGKAIKNDDSWNPPPTWDARQRPWYPVARDNNEAVLTAPYADSETGNILISAVARLTDKGQFVGAIGGDISLTSVAETINAINFNGTGYAFLVSRDGNIISHPNTELNGKPLATLLGQKPSKFNARLQPIELQGSTQLLAFQPVADLPGRDWLIGVMLDESKVMADANEFGLWAIAGAVLSTLLSCVVLYLLMQRILAPLGRLTQALGEISQGGGDLTQRLNLESRDEFGGLAKSFDSFISYLQSLISEIKREAASMQEKAANTADSAATSTSHIRQQLDELDQLATAMHQMSATAHQVAQNAQTTAEAAQEADRSAQDGARVVEQTRNAIDSLVADMNHAMANINQLTLYSNNIESILTTIVDISEQTNLLALNAAIEAARAGDLGRGFAVVADEVRALASRTQQSTTEIRGMIEQLQQGVANAESSIRDNTDRALETQSYAQKASESLASIRDSIRSINEMTVQIATAAEEQSSTTEEINRNTTNIRDLSQQVSNGAEQQTELCQTMNTLSQQQSQQLGRFKV
ncbi:methyl-accepting chemotaxis protein [Marinobacterium sediminicola]|uniref:Methyl-accepting chemotaxis sensory transducer with Cache sensor n=1 Tax=Marinobacterium sediminicola TaxID=518898 RepID=A0ABY1S211_9GAMM|nr:methyl-accepting chemotaxis protein [Marinobacterium sediminicola]ULG69385.1 methyl-accepting chemotaxis protein [Marinobacterium sediminicola]SMR75533.1 methyl-accepting chemotaxis sensory transducer with Cache sensor [Marinobacterium sediminicola]